jgi:hypothetical protein
MGSQLGGDSTKTPQQSFSLGAVYGYDDNVDPDVLTGTTTPVQDAPASFARIVKIEPNKITVQMPDGKTQDLTSFQGKPVTENIMDANGHVTTIINRQLGFPNVQKQTDEQGHTFTTLMLSGGTMKPQADKKKLSEITKNLTQMAQDADPKKRSDFLSLQDRLYKGGYYGGQKPIRGVPDATFSKALNNALLDSVKTGQPLDEFLAEAVAGNLGNGPESEKKVARDIRLTNTTDIAQAIKSAAPDILGRAVDAQTIQRIIESYHKLESDQQNSLYDIQDQQNASVDGGVSATTYTPPSVSSYVNDQVQASNPGLADANTFAGGYDALTNAIEKSAASVR